MKLLLLLPSGICAILMHYHYLELTFDILPNIRTEEMKSSICGEMIQKNTTLGATLWKGSILEPNLISSGEDNNNSDLEITKVWKIIIIYILLCCGPLNLHSELSFR